MKTTILYVLCVLAAALTALSCTWDEMPGPDGKSDGDDGKYISFVIGSVPGTPGSATRSTPTRGGVVAGDDAFNENLIDFDQTNSDVHIFFFNEAGTQCIFYPEKERLVYDTGNAREDLVTIKIKVVPEAGDDFPVFDAQNLLVGKSVRMYVVANSGLDRDEFLTSPGGTTVKPLRTIMEQTLIAATLNATQPVEGGTGIVPQPKFVMDALDVTYVTGHINIATMYLKRVAAKIEMGLYGARVAGYTLKSTEVKMCNFVNRSALGLYATQEAYTPSDGDYSDSGYITVPAPPVSGTPADAEYADPFYSYPSDWSADPDRQAYLLLKMEWYPDGDESAVRPYYYKIPLSDIPADGEDGADFRNRLRRNYIYRYYVTVNSLGGFDPATAAVIGGNLDIIGWTDENVATSIQKFDWLLVDELNVIMYPVPGEAVQEYLISYKSNTPLKFTPGETKITYEKYTVPVNLKEPVAVRNYPSNPSDSEITQYPYIDLNHIVDGQRYIRIRSRTPVNYVPKTINFKVENEAMLYAIVNVMHYPALYVTGKVLSGSGNNTKFSYTVTTLAITGDEKFPSPNYAAIRNRTYNVGSVFTKNGSGKFDLTSDNADNAWVVSPKFTIQSRETATDDTRNRGEAKSYCQNLKDGGYASGWRLPTLAELYLIFKLQNDSNSALVDALVGSSVGARAWAAGTYFLHDGSRDTNGTIFQMRSAAAGGDKYIGDELSPIWFFGYNHVAVCVRDFYQ